MIKMSLIVAVTITACGDNNVPVVDAQPDAPTDALDAGVDVMIDAEVDAYVPVCWTYHASHCVTTNGGIEQVCVPYDGCGCYRCLNEPDAGNYCYCGPGGL